MIDNFNKESPFYEAEDKTDYIYNNNIFIPLYPGEQFIMMIPIPGVINVKPNCYCISNYGRIVSFATGRAMQISGSMDNNGYISVKLRNMRSDSELYRVHRLVMIYFNLIPNCQDMGVEHINGIRTDNRLENLRWTDKKGITKTLSPNRSYNPNKFLKREQILEIYNKSAEKIDDQKYADEYGVSRNLVKNIRLCIGHYGKIMPDKQPIHHEKGNRKFSEEESLKIYESCKVDSVEKIARDFGVDRTAIDDIKNVRKGYSYLHDKYGLEPLKNLREDVSEEKAIAIHKALAINTTKDVAKQFNVCEKTVYLIKFCLDRFSYLSTKYNLTPYSKLRGDDF